MSVTSEQPLANSRLHPTIGFLSSLFFSETSAIARQGTTGMDLFIGHLLEEGEEERERGRQREREREIGIGN